MQFKKFFFILELYKFLACLECISRNGLSTANRAQTQQHQNATKKIRSGQFYGEILVSSNLNSKLFCFHCVRPSVGTHRNLKQLIISIFMILILKKRQGLYKQTIYRAGCKSDILYNTSCSTKMAVICFIGFSMGPK